MNGLEAVIAGAIQGTIEWLPISSEAQTMLYMLNYLQMEPQTALTYAFFLHIGTMIAVVIRFREEFIHIFQNFRLDYKLTRILVIASLSTAVTALPLYFVLKSVSTRVDPLIFTLLIGVMLIVTGIILRAPGSAGEKGMERMSDRETIIVGLAQGCAIVPGISRSGITMAALLAQKISPETALTISFLMSVPAAIGIFLIDFGAIRLIPVQTAVILTVSALVFGYLSINLLLMVARRTPFWIFCIIFGAVTVLFVLLI